MPEAVKLSSEPTPTSHALNVQQLSWRHDDKAILSQVSFTLNQGEMLGLIGPNGAGKSSLLRCLYRFIQPTAGSISLFGQDIGLFSPKTFARQVAVVQQDTPHYFEMSAAQIVAMGLTPHKGMFESHSHIDTDRVNQALAKVGLSHKSNQEYERLSGGEKQRALIARAIVQQPKLLILDEPTNHLDVRYQIQILTLVRSLGISVIASIHDLNLASALCDSLLLLDKGEVVAKGAPKQVLTEASIDEVFGVKARVMPHPENGNPQINYYYGVTNSDDNTRRSESVGPIPRDVCGGNQ
ncbi:ABC transporter ATP-binding protein [Shewanella sp. A25]|nr:ABC transporter ATP-binding protein [Shewanella shenzhenensis]